jgi:hypothetical protein
MCGLLLAYYGYWSSKLAGLLLQFLKSFEF